MTNHNVHRLVVDWLQHSSVVKVAPRWIAWSIVCPRITKTVITANWATRMIDQNLALISFGHREPSDVVEQMSIGALPVSMLILLHVQVVDDK